MVVKKFRNGRAMYNGLGFSVGPVAIDGTGLTDGGKAAADDIHRQNLAKLSSMDQGEILAEQRKLVESLGAWVGTSGRTDI